MSDKAGTPATEIQWKTPVTAEAKNTSVTTLTGPSQAYEFLVRNWTRPRGTAYIKATQALTGAIAGKIHHEDARSAFIAACSAAGCLVEGESG